MLGLYGRPLISQEVAAWPYGPIISDLYHSLKKYGGSPATEGIAVEDETGFGPVEENLIEQVLEKYGGLSGPELSTLTHGIGSPWHVARYESKSRVIPNDLIREHHARMAERA